MEIVRTYNQPIPIADRIKTISPICEGHLYAHEVLILYYAHKYTTGINPYEGFWEYKYGISDMDTQLNALRERGFLRIGTLEETMQTRAVTLPILKDIARSHGLKVGGKKNDIIQRILSGVNEDELNHLFPNRPYRLTDLGQTIMEKENYMKYIHNQRDSNLDIWTFSEMMHNITPAPYTEVLQKYYSQKAGEFLVLKQYNAYCENLLYQSEACIEGKMYDIALDCICRIIYCDLNAFYALIDGKTYSRIPIIEPYEKTELTISPWAFHSCCSCLEKLNIDNDKILEKILPIFRSIEIPFAFFTQEECANIVALEILNDSESLKKIYQVANQRFKTDGLKDKIIQNLDAHYRSAFGMSFNKHEKMHNEIITKLQNEAAEANKIYDPEWEKEIEERLSKLDELYRREFYRIRSNRKNTDSTMSNKRLDLLTLESMEKSFHYHNG